MGGILNCIFLYRCWNIIQDGYARTTPGKAIGFMFIPLFNFYWLFILWHGLACNLNAYIRRHQIPTLKVNEGLALTACIMNFIPVLNFFAIFIAIPMLFSFAKAADAIQQSKQS